MVARRTTTIVVEVGGCVVSKIERRKIRGSVLPHGNLGPFDNAHDEEGTMVVNSNDDTM